jgi:hypothetical protein
MLGAVEAPAPFRFVQISDGHIGSKNPPNAAGSRDGCGVGGRAHGQALVRRADQLRAAGEDPSAQRFDLDMAALVGFERAWRAE